MSIENITGLTAVISASAIFLSMMGLAMTFEYPKIIRKDTNTILTKLYEKKIVPYLYYLFGLAGLLLVYVSILMGLILANTGEHVFSEFGKTSGIIYGVLLFAGIIRYTGLFPKIAEDYVKNCNDKKICESLFQSFNYYIGNTVTEHVAFLFLAAMILFFSIGYFNTLLLPTWLCVFGIITSLGMFIGNLEFLGLKKMFVINRIFSSVSGVWLFISGICFMI